MLLTTEEAKRRILDYLEEQAESWNGHDFRPFTHEAIVAALDTESDDAVEKALESLQEESNLNLMSLQIKTYVPESKAGKNVARNLASVSYRIGSWGAAMFWSLVIMYAFLTMLPIAPGPEEGLTSIEDAFQEGVLSGIFYAVLPGMLLAAILHLGWTAYRRSALMREDLHQRIAWFTKASMFPAATLVALYLVFLQYTESPFNLITALALFLAAFPIAWGYAKLVKEDKPVDYV